MWHCCSWCSRSSRAALLLLLLLLLLQQQLHCRVQAARACTT
jgi:hypothetical protein